MMLQDPFQRFGMNILISNWSMSVQCNALQELIQHLEMIILSTN